MINLDELRWVLQGTKEYTPLSRMGANSNAYFNNQDSIIGGEAITLRGEALAIYKAAYREKYGEAIKSSTLLVLDRDRVQAYINFLDSVNQLSYSSQRELTPSNTDSNAAQVHIESFVDDSGILQELAAITKDKNLHWVPYEGKIYLVMAEASIAKGMEKDDYSSNWCGKLPGEARLLEGPALHEFKAIYVKECGAWPYPRTRSIRIGDWVHAYAYLVQGKSSTATTFQTMGANSIQKQATIEAPPCPVTWTSEQALVDRVFRLMELSSIKMQREFCMANTLANTPVTRRLDAIEHIRGEDGTTKVHAYEFKKDTISLTHIVDTIAIKGYLHLVRELYPTSKVCLFLVGNRIEPQAQRLLECMHGVMYLPLSTLLNRVLQDIVSTWPKEGMYQLRTHFLAQYEDILPAEMLKGPIPHQPILTTYHRPRVSINPQV